MLTNFDIYKQHLNINITNILFRVYEIDIYSRCVYLNSFCRRYIKLAFLGV